eukprot:TRINITY_DN90817_c0_g1_i1.p1 TRINITY_DN90817_c0_g1~~TRINITY_DN90817_c0_g1_i1.p1  ORF type:complete len:414 (+),score=75.69 TRINITY_DN90817_c0_g1_i1:81-1322(+)
MSLWLPRLPMQIGTRVPTDDETITRVRSVLKTAFKQGGQSAKRGERQSDRWKRMFMLYDKDHSGELDLGEIRRAVRKDLKLTERVISDADLSLFYKALDANHTGTIDFQEWLNFVQKGKGNVKKNDEQVLQNVGRCLWLCSKRRQLRLDELPHAWDTFESSVSSGSPGLSLTDMKGFCRQIFGLEEHECSNANLMRLYKILTAEVSERQVSKEDFVAFVHKWVQNYKSSVLTATSKSTGSPLGRKGGSLAEPTDHDFAFVPFNLHGRDLPPRSRLAAATSTHTLDYIHVEDFESPTAATSSEKMAHRRKSFASPGSEAGQEDKPPVPETKRSNSEPSLPRLPTQGGSRSSARARNKGPAIFMDDRPANLPSSSTANYSAIKGGHTLQRLESQLYQSGVDMRGQYHVIEKNPMR